MAAIQQSRQQLSHDRLLEVLDYDQATGVFTWKVKTGRGVCIGRQAGADTSNGYRRIRIDNVEYLAHRLAWFYVYGTHPEKLIDHIDGNKQNNAISNLRVVTFSENIQNQKRAMPHNKTGYLGVSPHGKNVFRAAINVDGQPLYLGSFKTPEAAHAAYLSAKRTYHSVCTI